MNPSEVQPKSLIFGMHNTYPTKNSTMPRALKPKKILSFKATVSCHLLQLIVAQVKNKNQYFILLSLLLSLKNYFLPNVSLPRLFLSLLMSQTYHFLLFLSFLLSSSQSLYDFLSFLGFAIVVGGLNLSSPTSHLSLSRF